MSEKTRGAPDGILLIDKPRGCTSHDVVGVVRRLLRTREVGHAGTLDPMATGLLVVLVGEGTKLSAYLTADSKAYTAGVRFGVATDSLDADGAVTETREGEAPARAAIVEALAKMQGPMMQVPPAVSALKVDGVRAYDLARKGEAPEMAPRAVSLGEAAVVGYDAEARTCDVELSCSKGFYVRSFARDLAARLGTVAHLYALRRTRSGAFDVREAHSIGLDGAAMRSSREHPPERAEALARAVIPLANAARAMPSAVVCNEAASALAQGKARWWADARLDEGPATLGPDPEHVVLVFTPGRAPPVCLARVFTDESGKETLTSVRGFLPA